MWNNRSTRGVVISSRFFGALILAAFFVLVSTGAWAQTAADNATTPAAAASADNSLTPPAQTPAAAASAAPAAFAAPNAALETTSSTYKLQPYDLIDVSVYSEEDLHKPARLGSDGTVLLPLIGVVKLGGLTVADATDLITKKYGAGYVKNPSVLITVLQYRKSTFSLLGQVAKPGVFEIPEGAHFSILEAISMAGGFGATASQNSVTVKRSVDGKDTILRIRAGDMAQNPEATPFEVLAGDTIMVPAAQFQQSSFTVLGQVSKPGLYQIPEGAHVSIIDAISLAGGFMPAAAQNGILVKRTAHGKTVSITVRAKDMAQDPNTAPFEVLAGDSIVVPFRNSTFSIQGQVEKPGMYEIQEGDHVDIIQAILMAGGYTRLASQNGVIVKRMVGGKPTTVKVPAGDMAKNPTMVPFQVQAGDIITVKESWF